MSDPKSPLEEKLESKLDEVRRREEEARARLLADNLGLPYISLIGLPISTEALIMIEESQARRGGIVCLKKLDSQLKIAVADPENPAAKKLLDDFAARGFAIGVFITSKHDLERAFSRYKTLGKKEGRITGRVDITEDLIKSYEEKFKTLKNIQQILVSMTQEEATPILAAIIAGALKNDSSDIHLEGREKDSILRYRIDGILHDVAPLATNTYNLILSRIKLLSGMVLNVKDRAQDGRFTIRLHNMDMEVRVSVIPGPYGENVVMRLLNPKNIQLGLKDLGMREDLYAFLKKEIIRPNGMILTTGPTGSGKTTTLYAFLKEITSPDVKIITLEDPIEYHLAGATQTQVEAEQGYTFAAGLRAILRQDPDIILVGEIRDKETAEIAIHAALTGHIVFSTIHTNDAAGAIPRFIDMGANPTILSAALIDIMAQRLLRRICPDCKESREPSVGEKEKIKKALTGLPKEIKIPDAAKELKLYRGKGCDRCNQTGYRGRIGVYENIAVNAEIEKLITQSPSHAAVLEAAKKNGFISMYQDGVIKILEGVTTFEELDSVVGISE